MIPPRLRPLVVLAWLFMSGFGATAQSAAAQGLPGLPAVAPTPEAVAEEDPLKRDTPRGTVLGFVTAAQSGNDTLAAQYLQWPRTKLGIPNEEAARELMFALNHGYEGKLEHLSRTPEGSLLDGLPADRERVGRIVLASGERVDIALARVERRGTTPIWLIASETVAEIPRLHEESGLPHLEQSMPRVLTQTQFGGLPVWVPLALIVLLPVIYVGVRLLLGGMAWLVRTVLRHRPSRTGQAWFQDAWAELARPTAFLLTVYLHGVAGHRIGIPLYHRFMYTRTITFLFLIGLAWWLWRLQDLISTRIKRYLESNNLGRAQSAYIIGRRALQVLTFIICVLVGLAAFGVDLSTTLAGLGIGGLALAFAAQKTLENVFAGISVLVDRSIAVGDVYQIGSYTGTIEDVGLRTMRMRTPARTVVHIPNGTLATAEVENLSRRDKFLLQAPISLRLDTSPHQLDSVLSGIRDCLRADPEAETESQRVRLVRIGPQAIEIELFVYFLVSEFQAFLVCQERTLARILAIVADAGTGLAPSGTTIVVDRGSATQPAAAFQTDAGSARS